jgi:thiamine monophosphate synthase
MSKESKKSAPDCGLYIRIPDSFNILTLVPQLQQVFTVTKRSQYEKNMHVLEFPAHVDAPDGAEHIQALVEFAQVSGFVALVRGDAVVAQMTKADGVLVDAIADVAPARALLGADKIVGLRGSKDAESPERVIELGIDYMALPAQPPVIAQWATKFDLPILADGPITNDDVATFVRAGATFVNASVYILEHPKGILQGTVDMLYAIDLAVEARAN